MASITVSRTVLGSAEDVWAKVGNFEDPSWLPGAKLVSFDGATRTLSVPPNATLVETLLEQGEQTMTWAMADTPLPVKELTLTLSAHGGEDATELVWEAAYTSVGIPDAQAGAILTDMLGAMLSAAPFEDAP